MVFVRGGASGVGACRLSDVLDGGIDLQRRLRNRYLACMNWKLAFKNKSGLIHIDELL